MSDQEYKSFKVCVLDENKHNKWQPWTGEFKKSDGYNAEKIEKHIKVYFTKERYQDLKFGILGSCADKRLGSKEWDFIKYIDMN